MASEQVQSESPEPGNIKKHVSAGTIISWVITLVLVAVMLAVFFQFNPFKQVAENSEPVSPEIPIQVDLPSYAPVDIDYSLDRLVDPDTQVLEGQRQYAIKYTVEEGDSIFAISEKFSLQPESILWANYDLLHDDPTFLAPGWKLTIPPTDGVYYQWEEGDSLEKIAEKYKANQEDILRWPSNKLDVTQPDTKGLEYVMIPGGFREIAPWIQPLVYTYTSGSGVTRVIEGGCAVADSGYSGSGGFIWPTYNHHLSGFDFTSYHRAIDIAALEGTPVVAADSGTVIYSGWNNSGYGNLIVISHRNGYESLYAHLSYIGVPCGKDVFQGEYIGAAGSTGKSTGAHLHFEIRLFSSFINPWSVLGP